MMLSAALHDIALRHNFASCYTNIAGSVACRSRPRLSEQEYLCTSRKLREFKWELPQLVFALADSRLDLCRSM